MLSSSRTPAPSRFPLPHTLTSSKSPKSPPQWLTVEWRWLAKPRRLWRKLVWCWNTVRRQIRWWVTKAHPSKTLYYDLNVLFFVNLKDSETTSQAVKLGILKPTIDFLICSKSIPLGLSLAKGNYSTNNQINLHYLFVCVNINCVLCPIWLFW